MAGRPSMWGKLPAFGDFVRSRVTAPQMTEWNWWLARHPVVGGDAQLAGGHAMPWSFVLAPGSLRFSGRLYVAGVMADSCDRVGRRHPFLIFLQVKSTWLQHNLTRADNALFWMARLLARHASPAVATEPLAGKTNPSLRDELDWMWSGGRFSAWRWLTRAPAVPDLTFARDCARYASGAGIDVAKSLTGVAQMPWADWPRCLEHSGGGWFWQQDHQSGYVSQFRLRDASWQSAGSNAAIETAASSGFSKEQ